MSMTTELLAALWLTVLPAQQQIVRVANPHVFVRPIEADAAESLWDLRDAQHRRFADAVSAASAGAAEPPVVVARLEAVEVLHEGDRHAQLAVRATCPVNARCRVPGLVARQVAFEVESIRWTAGAGWPEYRLACPRDYLSSAMRYPDALVHQLVLAIGAGEVSFLVNDDKYDDNNGAFTVLIESWD